MTTSWIICGSSEARFGENVARLPMTEIDVRAVDEFEAAGWELVAARYETLWSPITGQAIDPLLDAASVEPGMRVLDVGTGAGDAAARAAERGAETTGVDIAAAMVELAARLHPAASFVQASAIELPFANDSFDAAVGNIVIQHIGEPERAVRARACARTRRASGAVNVGCSRKVAVLRGSARRNRGRRGPCSERDPARPVLLPVRR